MINITSVYAYEMINVQQPKKRRERERIPGLTTAFTGYNRLLLDHG